jgi:hypothetical protein
VQDAMLCGDLTEALVTLTEADAKQAIQSHCKAMSDVIGEKAASRVDPHHSGRHLAGSRGL